jgi:predicted MFS family arabinose efflux permease
VTVVDPPRSPSFLGPNDTRHLMMLFSAMYFVQGIAEPTEGLIAQPVRSLLKVRGYSTSEIATFAALLALPWTLKPLYGLLTDFVPIAGMRRRSYLLLTSWATVLGLSFLYLVPLPADAYWLLLTVLLIPTVGVAFSDVVVDALMVEVGQPRGLTGRLQSVQWAAMYGASMLAAYLGGWLSQYQLQELGFLLCAAATLVTCGLAWAFVREKTESLPLRRDFIGRAADELWQAARQPAVVGAGLFLLLWNFNPFNTAVLYMHMTRHLGMSEQFYGVSVTIVSAGAVAASLAYGLYCRHVSVRWLLHLAIAAGILCTLAYWALDGPISAAVISALVGFFYMTGSMVQMDLAARTCPLAAAGTTFALLMAVSNLGVFLSTTVGGLLYEHWSELWGPEAAFDALVAAGAASSSACWLLVPWLSRVIRD